MRDCDINKLKEEYERLVEGLKDAQLARETDIILANPILPDEVLEGCKRLIFRKKFVTYKLVFLFTPFLVTASIK